MLVAFSLLVTFCLMFVTFYSLLFSFCLVPHSVLLVAHYFLLDVHYFLLVARYFLLVRFHCLLVARQFFICYIILLFEYLCSLHIFVISKTDDRTLKFLHYFLFRKVICAFEQGNGCSKLVIKIKTFDSSVNFFREYWLWKINMKYIYLDIRYIYILYIYIYIYKYCI